MSARAFVPLLLLAALGATLAWVSCAPSGAQKRSDLRLLWTGAVMGFVEPCGCTAGRLGGLDRMAAYLRAELERHPDALFLDAGNLIARHPTHDGLLEQQLPMKAEAFLRVFGELGISALAVGVNELAVEPETLAELGRRHRVPLVSANLARVDGSPAFARHVIVTRGGKRIGITSVIAPSLRGDDMDNRRTFDVAALAARRGLVLEPWEAALERELAYLREQCDMIVLASHLGHALNRTLPARLAGIDLILGPHFDDAVRAFEVVENTPVLVSPLRGARVGVFDWWWPRPQEFFGANPRPALNDVSDHLWLPLELELHRRNLALLEGREAALGGAEHARQRAQLALSIAEGERRLANPAPWPAGNAFSSMLVPLSAAVSRDEGALDALDHYHEAVRDHWESHPAQVLHPNERFVGPQACSDCHPKQLDFWYTTSHSRAIHTLEASLQHRDMECIACHTVGHEQPGGFRRPETMSGFENVQCAACHGAGGPHMEGGASFLKRELLRVPMATCRTCHNKEHDPSFDTHAAEKLARVACPPMGPPHERTQAHRLALHGAAVELAATAAPDWGLVSDAFARAGDGPAALGAAERWLAQERGSIPAHLKLAQRRIENQQPSEALELVARVLSRQPQNGVAWQMRAAALLQAAPREALTAALEAYSLRPDDVESIRLVGTAYAAAGQRLQALEALRQHLERRPQDREALASLLEQLR